MPSRPACPRCWAGLALPSSRRLRVCSPIGRRTPTAWAAKSSRTCGEWRNEEVREVSRIGKLPVPIPSGVEVTVDGQLVKVLGPKGALEHRVAEPIKVTRGENGELQVSRPDDERESKS